MYNEGHLVVEGLMSLPSAKKQIQIPSNLLTLEINTKVSKIVKMRTLTFFLLKMNYVKKV